ELSADINAPGERELPETPGVDETLHDWAGRGCRHDSEDVSRPASELPQPSQNKGDCRRLLGGLEEDSAPSSEGRCDRTQCQGYRQVPRRDPQDGTDRLVPHFLSTRCTSRREDLTGQRLRIVSVHASESA